MSISTLIVDACLFDMDGTLVDSTPAANFTFEQFKRRHGIVEEGHPHGIRMVDSCRKWFPEASDEDIRTHANQFELDLLDNAKQFVKQGQNGIVVLPGVGKLLAGIKSQPGAEQHYTICTSASRHFASQALATAGIVPPIHLIASDDCEKGKPHPEPYLKGAAALQKDITKCVVFEDAPAGIKAGIAAGAATIAVCTSHTREQLAPLGATYIVDNLDSVSLTWTDNGKMALHIS